MRTKLILVTAAAVCVLSACEKSPTDMSASGSTQVEIQSALMGGGSAFVDGGPQPAIMARLVEAAFSKIRRENGADSARAIRERLSASMKSARDAMQSHDSVAARAALQEVHHAEAEIVVSVLGAEGVARAIDFADKRIAELNDRIAHATAGNAELPRLQALATNLNQIIADAKAAAAAGDNVSALLSAVKATEALHIIQLHRFGSAGNLPVDTTRVHH